MSVQLPDKTEHRQALFTCLEFWKRSESPVEQREMCFEWIERQHFETFGERLHPSHLLALERRGWLTKSDATRGGSRRYYRLTNPVLTERMMAFLRIRVPSLV